MLLLSIKSPFAQAIYAGLKIAEFRRLVPKRGIPGCALIYETKPKGMVTGAVFIERAIEVPPGGARDIAGPHDAFTGFYDDYLAGARQPCALKLSKTVVFDEPQDLTALTGLAVAPQSYAYVDPDRPEIIARLPPGFCRSIAFHSATGSAAPSAG